MKGRTLEAYQNLRTAAADAVFCKSKEVTIDFHTATTLLQILCLINNLTLGRFDILKEGIEDDNIQM